MKAEVAVQMHMALNAAIGVELVVSDVDAFKRLFYLVRAEARTEGFHGFDELTLRTCPIDAARKIWIVRKRDAEGKT